MHDDGSAGATTAKNIWTLLRNSETTPSWITLDPIIVKCTCCSDFSSWKKKHYDEAKQVQLVADKPCYYQVCDEKVEIDGIEYDKTIRALAASNKGACMKRASTSGSHPRVCIACNALRHGKTSVLMRKLYRSKSLKHSRDEPRVGKPGIRHKYLSKSELQAGILYTNTTVKGQKSKIVQLQVAQQRSLKAAWTEDDTLRPFVCKLIELLNSNSLSEFDFNFLSNWISKKCKGRNHYADEQARSLAILLSNRLGEKLYSTVVPIMGLPLHRQAQRIRAKNMANTYYMPGLNMTGHLSKPAVQEMQYPYKSAWMVLVLFE